MSVDDTKTTNTIHYNMNAQGSCPSCGYCPHCGRSNGHQAYPYYPYYPYWYNGTVTVTAIGTDGVDSTGASWSYTNETK
jgi:hypothetical protein